MKMGDSITIRAHHQKRDVFRSVLSGPTMFSLILCARVECHLQCQISMQCNCVFHVFFFCRRVVGLFGDGDGVRGCVCTCVKFFSVQFLVLSVSALSLFIRSKSRGAAFFFFLKDGECVCVTVA